MKFKFTHLTPSRDLTVSSTGQGAAGYDRRQARDPGPRALSAARARRRRQSESRVPAVPRVPVTSLVTVLTPGEPGFKIAAGLVTVVVSEALKGRGLLDYSEVRVTESTT